MERIWILFAAVVPALVCLVYGLIRSATDWRSEALWNAFLLGAMSAVAGSVAGFGVKLLLGVAIDWNAAPTVVSAGLSALFIAGLPEETAKFAVLTLIAARHIDARWPRDTIMLSVAVALGFAALENVFYVARPTGVSDWTTVAALRAVIAVPGHAIDGLAMGALLAMRDPRVGLAHVRSLVTLAVPVAMHTAYDFPLMLAAKSSNTQIPVAWLVIAAINAAFALWLCRRACWGAGGSMQTHGPKALPRTKFILAGAGLFAVATALSVAFLVTSDGFTLRNMVALSIFPAALAGDLLMTGLRSSVSTPRPGTSSPRPSLR
ncbi:MAG: PrsW family intramembrane metalloprotease [Gemmatimonas sp.]